RGCVGQPFARVALNILLARLCRDHYFCQAPEPATELSPNSRQGQDLQQGAGERSSSRQWMSSTEGETFSDRLVPEMPKAKVEEEGKLKEMQAGFTVLPLGGVK
ncbi:unnamed protein product, partial [Choristocarpus tenellus]